MKSYAGRERTRQLGFLSDEGEQLLRAHFIKRILVVVAFTVHADSIVRVVTVRGEHLLRRVLDGVDERRVRRRAERLWFVAGHHALPLGGEKPFNLLVE